MSSGPKKPRILVADDDPILRSVVVARLKSSPFDILEAGDGLEAWHLIKRGNVRLALVDIEMPNMNGIALAQCIRSDPETRHIPVVMITSRDDSNSVKRALEAGATSYLTKPVNWSLFSEHVEHLIRMGQEAEIVSREKLELERLTAACAALLETVHAEMRTRPREVTRRAQELVGDAGPGAKVLLDELDVQRAQLFRLGKWAGIAARASKEKRRSVSLVKTFVAQAHARSASGQAPKVLFQDGASDITIHGYPEAIELLAASVLDLAGAAAETAAIHVAMTFTDCNPELRLVVPMNEQAPRPSGRAEREPGRPEPLRRSRGTSEATLDQIGQIAILHGGHMTVTPAETPAWEIVIALPADCLPQMGPASDKALAAAV